MPERSLYYGRFNGSNEWMAPFVEPLTVFNLELVESGSGYALSLEGKPPKLLRLPAVDPRGKALFRPDLGTLRLWFKPAWSSQSVPGGTGPGAYARLIEAGAWTSDASLGWWALYFNPEGTAILFSSQAAGQGADYLKAPIQWRAGEWHQIALAYSPKESVLYLDGEGATWGEGVAFQPDPEALARQGFTVGSHGAGDQLAQGQFDEVATFDYPCSPEEVLWNYRTVGPSLRLGPITPEEEERFRAWWVAMTEAAGALRGEGALLSGEPECLQGCPELKLVPVVLPNADVKLCICGGETGARYDLFFTPNLNPPLTWAWLTRSRADQTDFVLSPAQPWTGFFQLGTMLDTDGDGLTDAYENLISHTSPTTATRLDSDGDGLLDAVEVQLGTNPHDPDTDDDGLPDGWEVSRGLNPLVHDAAGDLDGDGSTNLQEYQNGTNPTEPREAAGPSSRRTGFAISEIMFAPLGTDGSEFIEIYNAHPTAESLDGFGLIATAVGSATPAMVFTFPSSTMLLPGSFLVVAKTPANVASPFGNVLGPYAGDLPDTAATIRLTNRLGAVLLEARYAPDAPWPTAAAGGGHSLILARPSFGEGNPAAWSASDKVGGSPGRPDFMDPEAARQVVINEFVANAADPQNNFVELYNHSSQAVTLTGWQLAGDISFTFPSLSIPAQGYVVIARNPSSLLASGRYPQLNADNTKGPIEPNLPNGGGRIILRNTQGIVVDEVSYGDGGRWGQWSDGGGSSLELIDPRSDNRLPSNWADSDETSKSTFWTVERVGSLRDGYLPYGVDIEALEVILLEAGECLIDNVEVRDPSNNHLLAQANRDFESGIAGWTAEGNHDLSTIEPAPPNGLGGDGSNQSYHLRAAGRGDYLANRLRVALSANINPDANGQFTLRARVRWLRGHPEIVLRLRGNYLEADGNRNLENSFPASRNFGTPGARNSVTAQTSPNTGPAIYDVAHNPVLPSANTPVVVTARFHDPDGFVRVAPLSPESPRLRYRVDPGTTLTSVLMKDDGSGGDAIAGDGVYSGTIPAQAAGTLVRFRIAATDNAGSPLTSRFPTARSMYPGDPEERECLVRWGDPAAPGGLGTYRLWMSQATFNRWSVSSGRSQYHNGNLDTTFVYGNDRAIYSTGARFAGSPWHSYGFNTPTGSDCGYALEFPSDDPFLGSTSVSFEQHNGDGSFATEQAAYWMQAELGVPSTYRRYAYFFVNGVLRGGVSEDAQGPNAEYLESWFPGDSDGDLYKLEVWWNDYVMGVGAGVGGNWINDDRNFTHLMATLEKFPPAGSADDRNRTRYRWNWLKRAVGNSANDYDSLFALIEAIHTVGPADVYGAQVAQALEVEEWARAFAIPRLVENGDMYSFIEGHNMYAYKPQTGKWRMIPFDQDNVFRGSYDRDIFEPYYDPVLPKFIHHPAAERAYWRAMHDAVHGPMRSEAARPLMDQKFNALAANNASPVWSYDAKGWIDLRRENLETRLSTVAAGFGVTTAGGQTAQNPVGVEGTAPVWVTSIRINGIEYPLTWTTRTTWRTAVPLMAQGQTTLEFTAFDAKGIQEGTPISRSFTYNGAYLPGNHPRINEWMVANTYVLADPADGDYEGWIELYNPRNVPFGCSGYKLKKLPGGAEWTIPPGTTLSPGGFLLVWADDEVQQNGRYGPGGDLHASFTLADNDTLELYAAGGGTPVDSVSIGADAANVSRGRYPDGQGAVSLLGTPTPRVANIVAVPPAVNLRINEWMPRNTSFMNDPADGNADDWIEILNAGSADVDLSGYSLTDNLSEPTKWVFPPGVIIPAGGYLLVWADTETYEYVPGQWELHANFNLGASGDEIGLYSPAGVQLDSVTWTSPIPENQSQGRCGSAIRTFTIPKPRQPNNCP